MFPCHRSHSLISSGDHFLETISLVLLKMRVHAIFDKNGGCVAIDHRPEARTPDPHMLPCHKSHFWISDEDHFLVKNP
jgi:hypothetical protein